MKWGLHTRFICALLVTTAMSARTIKKKFPLPIQNIIVQQKLLSTLPLLYGFMGHALFAAQFFTPFSKAPQV